MNTNWDVFVDHGTWYLLNNGFWYLGAAVERPLHARGPPARRSSTHCRRTANFAQREPACAGQAANAEGSRVTKIFVSTKPAEIIVTDGAPSFKPVEGTGLQRVVNTSSVLFFDPAAALFYLQLSGRWFSAAGLERALAIRHRQTAAGLCADSAERPRCGRSCFGPGHGRRAGGAAEGADPDHRDDQSRAPRN